MLCAAIYLEVASADRDGWRAVHTWCAASDLLEVDVRAKGLSTGVHLQNGDAALHVWPVHSHLHAHHFWCEHNPATDEKGALDCPTRRPDHKHTYLHEHTKDSQAFEKI